jgi:two-component system OmpR family response regulator
VGPEEFLRAPRLTVQDITVDPQGCNVWHGGERLPPMPWTQLGVLYALMSRAGRVVSAADLAAEIYEPDSVPISPPGVEDRILKIRRRLRTATGRDGYIRTVRGVGYVFDIEAVQ